MLSKHAEDIKKAINNVRESTDIESLLEKYDKKYQRVYIQKYAETKIAIFSSKLAYLAFLFAILAVIVTTMQSISLLLISPEDFQKYKPLYFVMFIIFLICFIITLYLYITKLLGKKNIFEKISEKEFENIIVAIEAEKLENPEHVESLIISKLNEIDNKVDISNLKMDALDKNLSTKIETIDENLSTKIEIIDKNIASSKMPIEP